MGKRIFPVPSSLMAHIRRTHKPMRQHPDDEKRITLTAWREWHDWVHTLNPNHEHKAQVEYRTTDE